MKRNILLTGGAGYIGSHVNKLLTKKGYKTIILDNLIYGHKTFANAKDTTFILGDTSDKKLLDLLFTNYAIDAVMHFAAFAYVGESIEHPSKYYNNNLVNTICLLDKMIEYNIKKMIFSSTCAVYGNPEYIPLDEKHPTKPINPYGKSKLMVEDILEDYKNSYGINYVTLRYFNVAGADFDLEIGEWHNPETHIIPILLDVAAGNREQFVIFGDTYDTKDGTCIRDYIHVIDLADCHIKALEWLTQNNKSNVFNVGSETGYSVMEILNVVKKITGENIDYTIGKKRPGDPPILIATSKKAKEILGYKPLYDNIDKIVDSAWKWYIKLNNLQ